MGKLLVKQVSADADNDDQQYNTPTLQSKGGATIPKVTHGLQGWPRLGIVLLIFIVCRCRHMFC